MTKGPRLSAACFDHLVGGDKQLLGHSDAEHPCRLGVNYQLELACLHHRQLRRLGALRIRPV